MSTRRKTRGILSQNRVQERKHLEKEPMKVADCIFNLRIVEDSQLYLDLILAIRQYTGYTKQFQNARGHIDPREINADGSLGTTFRSAFVSLVDAFLVERDGKLFFPPLVNDAWKGSFIEGLPRLIFENSDDEQEIRTNMRLLFEALKSSDGLPVSSNGKRFDCELATPMQSCDTDECFVCGSSAAGYRFMCRKCKCQFHAFCYDMAHVPEVDEKWCCRRCTNNMDYSQSLRAETSAMDISGADSPMLDVENGEGENSINMLATPSQVGAMPVNPSPARSGSRLTIGHGDETTVFQGSKDNTIVLARRKASKEYRLIDISTVDSLGELADACGRAWDIQVQRLFIYLRGNVGVLELRDDQSASLALKMFGGGSDSGEVVTIHVFILAAGETYQEE